MKFKLNVDNILIIILSVSQNNVMDLNNVLYMEDKKMINSLILYGFELNDTICTFLGTQEEATTSISI